MNSNCSNLLDPRNLQEQVKKAFCYNKLFWPFTVWINCSSDFKFFENSFKSFSWSLEQFFLSVGQNNFDNKIPLQKSLPLNQQLFPWSWVSHSESFIIRKYFFFPFLQVTFKAPSLKFSTIFLYWQWHQHPWTNRIFLSSTL